MGLVVMIHLVFKTTTACNFNCEYCYIKASESDGDIINSSKFIDIDTIYHNEPSSIRLFLDTWRFIKLYWLSFFW